MKGDARPSLGRMAWPLERYHPIALSPCHSLALEPWQVGRQGEWGARHGIGHLPYGD